MALRKKCVLQRYEVQNDEYLIIFQINNVCLKFIFCNSLNAYFMRMFKWMAKPFDLFLWINWISEIYCNVIDFFI